MAVFREQQRFPTRNYPYRAVTGAGPADAMPPESFRPNTLYRRVLGEDLQPRPMTPDELAGLDDPFGRLLRSSRAFPLTLRQVLAAIDALTGSPDALPEQLVFVAADGGHIAWTPATDRLQRFFRFIIARGSTNFPLLVSASTNVDSADDEAFLQVLAWDASHEVYQFYERLRGTFFWGGLSHHALEEATRGQGPFDSHVNGSMVMKELRPPWVHWHAPLAGINADALSPDDPLRREELFLNRITADRLEIEVVRPGIRRWNQARVRNAVGADGVWRHVNRFLRQAVTDTTVNLVTSETVSSLLTHEAALRLPLSFFINRDTLFDTLALVPDDSEIGHIEIAGRLYLDCLKRYDVHRWDGSMRIEGDSHFAFLVPEAAFEDTDLVDTMLQAKLLTPHFVACLAMTDFPNPVFSKRRPALLRYVPGDIDGARPAQALESQFVNAVRDAVREGRHGADQSGSPEREFLRNWDQTKAAFIDRINDYFLALKQGATDPEVVDGWFQLAEYRRRRFRGRRLAEFKLTTPCTNIPSTATAWRMTRGGRAEPLA